MPGESPAVFGDALRRLAAAATYLYQDGPRFWYATQPTVTKLAEDRAEQLKREPGQGRPRSWTSALRARPAKDWRLRAHPPAAALGRRRARRLRCAARRASGRASVQQGGGSAAEAAAQAILESRGNTPRLYRNTLVFLAADQVRLQDLDEARAQVPRVGVDPGREGRPSISTRTRCGRPKRREGGRRHRHRPAARDLPVAARAGAGESAGDGHLAGDPAHRRRRARGAGQQEAPQRRAARDDRSARRSCASTSTTSRSGGATTSRSASSWTTSPVTSTCRASRAPRCWSRRSATAWLAHVAVRHVRVRREPRRGRGPLSRVARRAGRLARSRERGTAREAGRGPAADGGRSLRIGLRRGTATGAPAAVSVGTGATCRQRTARRDRPRLKRAPAASTAP